jgi:hypothetical protein
MIVTAESGDIFEVKVCQLRHYSVMCLAIGWTIEVPFKVSAGINFFTTTSRLVLVTTQTRTQWAARVKLPEHDAHYRYFTFQYIFVAVA